MLMKLTPDPKSARRQHWCLDCLFWLLGSGLVKAALKYVGQIKPPVSTSPTFSEQLYHMKVFFIAFLWFRIGFELFGKRISAQKLHIKCWWNWLLVNNVKKAALYELTSNASSKIKFELKAWPSPTLRVFYRTLFSILFQTYFRTVSKLVRFEAS